MTAGIFDYSAIKRALDKRLGEEESNVTHEWPTDDGVGPFCAVCGGRNTRCHLGSGVHPELCEGCSHAYQLFFGSEKQYGGNRRVQHMRTMARLRDMVETERVA